jgi:hypothetical protein
MSVLEIAQINVVFQVIILMVLLTGYVFKRRSGFLKHGTAMLIAVVLNAVSIFLVMGPSLAARLASVQANPIGSSSIALSAHSVVGGLAELMGVWIVGSWHLARALPGFMNRMSCSRLMFELCVCP